jgi:hypothetical protein
MNMNFSIIVVLRFGVMTNEQTAAGQPRYLFFKLFQNPMLFSPVFHKARQLAL